MDSKGAKLPRLQGLQSDIQLGELKFYQFRKIDAQCVMNKRNDRSLTASVATYEKVYFVIEFYLV